MGDTLWKQGKLDEATKAWGEAATVYANGLKEQPKNLRLLRDDAELALIQGDIPRCQTRITTAMSLVKPGNEYFAILPFWAWLANPEQGWENVVTAIDELASGVKFTWDFSDITPAIERQDAETQQIAQYFIAFFDGKIDLPTLKARLAEEE